MSANQRSEPRNPCFLRGDIIVDAHTPPMPCEVHDISARGMRLVVLDSSRVPNNFIVSVPRRHLRETVRVARRAKQELGVVIQTR